MTNNEYGLQVKNNPFQCACRLAVESALIGNYYILQTARSHFGAVMFRMYNALVPEDQRWGKWIQLATAEPPQAYNLPLGESYQAKFASYAKTQENIVILNIDIEKTSGVIENNEVTAQLPEGFRPSAAFELPAFYWGSTEGISASIVIDEAGKIIARCSGYSFLRFSCSYVAAPTTV